MKKLIACLLLAVMALSCAAAAEELPLIEQYPLENYRTANALPEVCFPQICISPYGPSTLFESSRKEPWFITLPGPEGAVPVNYDADSCFFINPDHDIQYSYQAVDSYAYETFLNKCDDDANIVYDGEGKQAAYIAPDKTRAYALIGVPEIEKGAKLYIAVYYGGLRRASDQEKADTLRRVITEEIDRVKAQMTVSKLDAFWTEGKYRGVRIPADEISAGSSVVLPFPVFTAKNPDGAEETALLFPYKVDGNQVKTYACFHRGMTIEFEFKADTYSYVNSKKEDPANQISQITLSDGSAWEVYVSNTTRDGGIYAAYLHRVLSETAGRNQDKTCYLTCRVSFDHVDCPDLDALTGYMNVLADAGITLE